MHAHYFREAGRSMRHHRGLVTTAVFVLTAALALCATFLVLTHNAGVALERLGDRREMVVFLRDEVDEPARDALIGHLRGLYGSVTFVSRDQAWEEFRQQIGDPSLLEAVRDNPLPASLRVKLKPALLTPDSMEAAAAQVLRLPEVEDVRYGAEWVRRLDRFATSLGLGTAAIGLVVALAVLIVLYNTIRLTVLARRQQVEVMSRLGAGDRFIAWPFVLEAAFEAGLAAVLALALVFAVQRAAAGQLLGLVFLPPVWVLAFVLAAIVLAWVAAALALSRVLRAVGP